MKSIFDSTSHAASKLVTKAYSTSFSLGILLLDKSIRQPIYDIYGFVRYADEIVDTFHDYDKQKLFSKFKADTYEAIADGISLNPILNSFQETVNRYEIPHELIDTFLKSMEMDLDQKYHSAESYKEYILGSAEVVGLMCLQVFCEGDHQEYTALKPYAMSLGAAFQKVNFLRDIKDDYVDKGRVYFPQVDMQQFNNYLKQKIEGDIEVDFQHALIGIQKLPLKARLGVYVAYVYYTKLFNKIKKKNAEDILRARTRVPNEQKIWLIATSYFQHQFNVMK